MASNTQRQFDTAFDEKQYEIKKLIVSNNVLILTSGTGLGKTTRVPLYMIELFTRKGLNGKYQIKKIGSEKWAISNTNADGNIEFAYDLPYVDDDSIVLCTQPKELLAKENGNKTSHINKSIQNLDGINKNIISFRGKNREGGLGKALTFTTSGWLEKYMINNPYLNNGGMNVSCVIVDEAHERSLDIDLLLGLLKKVLLVRPEFKLVIMSATIKKELFINYFYNAPYIHIDKTLQDNNLVTIKYLDSVSFNYIYSILERLDAIINSNQRGGDIIVFISGIDDLLEVSKGLQYIENIGLYKLFYVAAGGNKQFNFSTNTFNDAEMVNGVKMDISISALKKITDPKIFFATNAVESSITIESLRFVIDPGVSQQSNYDAKIDMNFLTTLPITKASADQRKGRVGRVAAGTCYRLYTENFFKSSMKESTLSEILKTNIENVFIQMLSRGVNFLNFDYIEPPAEEQTFYTMNNLFKYGIIDNNFNIYTDLGTIDLTMATKYDALNYIDGYTIPNILLHIILTYTGNDIDLLIQVILLGSLYLESHKDFSEFEFKNLKNNNNWYSDFFLLYENNRQKMEQSKKFNTFYSNFVNKYNEYSDLDVSSVLKFYDINSLDIQHLIGHINDILSGHGNICNYGITTYNDNGHDYSIYFRTNFTDNAQQENNVQQRYTYVSCILKNNSFTYNLLTRI
jgi:hypothetical protein